MSWRVSDEIKSLSEERLRKVRERYCPSRSGLAHCGSWCGSSRRVISLRSSRAIMRQTDAIELYGPFGSFSPYVLQ